MIPRAGVETSGIPLLHKLVSLAQLYQGLVMVLDQTENR
jgi:hypothetical protein